MTRTLLTRCAPVAIAASVVLPAIPASAQATAEPVIVLPSAQPAPVVIEQPVAAPTIVLPSAQAAPATLATAPAEREMVQREAAPVRTVTRSVTDAPTRNFAPAVSPASDAVPSVPTNSEVATDALAKPVSAPIRPEPAIAGASPPTSSATSETTGEIALAALLGALGLGAVGGIAYAASRRRRANVQEFDSGSIPVDELELERAPAPTFGSTPALVFTAPASASTAFAAPVVARSSSATSAARASGDPIPLPGAMPQTFEERDALLKELVAAKPDRANPFTSTRARARRAKLIIQSLGSDFSKRKPRIDLSQYTNRWPELRGWQPATS